MDTNGKNSSVTLKKWYKSLNTWLLFVNILLSGFNCWLLCTNAPREKGDFDYIGILATVLSIFVTFLVAWNIYNIIDVKENMSMLKKHDKEIRWLKENKANKKSQINAGNHDSQQE